MDLFISNQRKEAFAQRNVNLISTDTGASLIQILSLLQTLTFKSDYLFTGVDFSGECNMTIAVTTVDLTPPGGGHITAGPYYEMVCYHVSAWT